MKLLVDMNLSPDWVGVLHDAGWEAIHWSAIGDPRADDRVLFDWARTQGGSRDDKAAQPDDRPTSPPL